MLERLQRSHPIDELNPVVSAGDFLACQQAIREVEVHPRVRRYILEIIHASRAHDDLHLGGSPRASIALFRTGQALAAVNGRNFVLPDDIKRMAVPVLGHRFIIRPESRLRKVTPPRVIEEILSEVSVPVLQRDGDDLE